MSKRWGREWSGVVKINRKDEAELEKAIADLTARGFEVIRRVSKSEAGRRGKETWLKRYGKANTYCLICI